ncbi:MAG: STAS domain-containing protein [Victivallaceae bacterium]|nr:STAS domain-containing protein [Victivallaceae bacterium]
MIKKSDLLIAHNKGAYTIIVEGRANFDYGLPLRNFAKNLDNNFTRITIDLGACLGMDSTFMGIMAMIGLKAKKNNVTVEVLNADKNNRYLLEGLGLDKLFKFSNSDTCGVCREKIAPDAKSCSMLNRAETVVEAHQTLMAVDKNNIQKFEKVVEFAKKDAELLKNKKDKEK